ncbi:hypothetical protein D3C80_1977960 [compost metagenome]
MRNVDENIISQYNELNFSGLSTVYFIRMPKDTYSIALIIVNPEMESRVVFPLLYINLSIDFIINPLKAHHAFRWA